MFKCSACHKTDGFYKVEDVKVTQINLGPRTTVDSNKIVKKIFCSCGHTITVEPDEFLRLIRSGELVFSVDE